MPAAPPSALPQGTKLIVGSHEVEIDRFIGEGGFAHVYTVSAAPPIPGHDVACLKRVQVPTKAYLNLLRAEVDAMQRLKGSSNIVQYFDSHAERMRDPPGQGHYEVFLLMEFCDGGGLIDFMNTRLRERLRENEILRIMYDITLGLVHMHYLTPPLLHRDLKIENVLIARDGSFKLCDFGSVSPVLQAPKTPQELKTLEDDIQHQTTVQYRAPEMVAIARGHPIDEKSDIWALGIFLYKLCYFTTPFERPNQTLEQFRQLILAGVFAIPALPAYSERLRNMIRVLLQQDPRLRPNAFQVMQEICAMRHVECPIEDIYSRPRAQPQPGNSGQIPPQAQSGPPGQLQAGQPGQLQLEKQQSQTAGQPSQPFQASQAGQSLQQARPAPGQVPVPGVLLTSPVATPSSPMLREVSPLDDEAKVSARFPSLEELDLPGSADLVDFNSSKPAKSVYDEDYPMPQRPASQKQSTEAQKLKQILNSISGKSSTVVLDKPSDKSLSSVDFLRTLQGSETSHHPHHSLKMHKPHRPAKYFHSEDDDDDDDDDVRLPSANPERKRESYSPKNYSSDLYSPVTFPGERGEFSDLEDSFNFSGSESVSPLASPGHILPVSPKKPFIRVGASAELTLPKLPAKLVSKLPTVKPKLELGRAAKSEDGDKLAASDARAGNIPPKKPHISSKPRRSSPGKLISHSATAPSVETLRARPLSRPRSMLIGCCGRATHTGNDLEAFKPSNSIQQRVQSFLSSHDRQHQTRRTTTGYGRFTDPETPSEDSHAEGSLSDFGMLRTRRSKSVDGGVPRTPSRALKPKLKQ